MAKTDKRRKTIRLPEQVELAIRAAEDKKATDLVVLDLRKAAGFTDFFVICSGTNPRQIRAIADSVMRRSPTEGVKPAHVEGYDRSEWMLLDYFDFIVHVFAPETRLFYGLERLWGNAERIEIHGGVILQASIQAAICRLTSAVQAALDPVLAVLLAPSCAACGQLLEHPTRGPVCESCWRSILPLTPPVCDRCGDPLPAWRAISIPLARCPRCRRGARHVDRARAVGGYDGALRAIVHALKYEGRRSLARPLAELMRIRGADMLTGADWVVPVPLHPSRRRQRGFNQAADLARHLGPPVCLPFAATGRRAPRPELPAARRHGNVRGAVQPWAWGSLAGTATRRLEGSIVVLIDDVSTTGATLDACARVLKEAAGVREVRALTAARVVTPPLPYIGNAF